MGSMTTLDMTARDSTGPDSPQGFGGFLMMELPSCTGGRKSKNDPTSNYKLYYAGNE